MSIRPGFSSATHFPQSAEEYEWARTRGSEVYRYLPQAVWTGYHGTDTVYASTLNQAGTATSERTLTVAAENGLIRTVYGEERIGPQIANVASLGGAWVVQAIWCEGEIDSINDVYFGDAAMPAGVTATHYTGTSGQTVNATLASAITGYADALPGIAYSVFVFSPELVEGFPQITARVKGLKLYDHRSGLTVWSNNPALALADFLVRAMGRVPDYATVDEVADACDETVGTGVRRTIGLTMDAVQECGTWLDVLRTYACCWVVPEGTEVRLVPDRPRATDATIKHADGQIAERGLRMKKRGTRQVPNVVRIRYTDTSAIPWRDAFAEAAVSGLSSVERRESEIALPGIQNYAQANREAIERLNRAQLCDLSIELDAFDESLELQVGDVVEVTHPFGLTDKKVRVTALTGSYGRWRIGATEYDPAVYSDAVATGPTWGDTTLPSPLDPPAVTGLVLAEEVYQLENGTFASRIRATWDAAAFAYIRSYRFEVWQDGQPIHTADPATTTACSAAVAQGVTYTVKVALVTSLIIGPFATDSIVVQGKLLIPGDVPENSFTGFEAGGTCYFGWAAAVDIDIWRYQLRYGTTGGSFATATILDEVDALRYQTKMIPAGTWKIYIVAVDSIKQLSVNPRTVTLTVTLDASAFLVDVYDQSSPTLTNMLEYKLGRTDGIRRFVTNSGQSWNAMFPSAMNSYTNPLLSYHSAVDSSWRGESEDFGQELSGDWQGQATVQALSGSIESEIQTSLDGSTWTNAGSLSAKATARFARLEHRSSGTATLYAEIPQQQITLNVTPRRETGAVSVAATGITTVTLASTYTAVKAIQVTPRGTAFGAATVDNVIVGTYTSDTDYTDDTDYFSAACSFDVYLFDASGARIAGVCDYTFDGV